MHLFVCVCACECACLCVSMRAYRRFRFNFLKARSRTVGRLPATGGHLLDLTRTEVRERNGALEAARGRSTSIGDCE